MEVSCAQLLQQHRFNHTSHHEAQSQQPATAAPVSTVVPESSFFTSPPHLYNYGVGFGAEGESGGNIYSQLSIMPLNTDGSLCIVEALSRSHLGLAPCPSPKLEDFLGCSPNRGTHPQYTSIEGMCSSPTGNEVYQVPLEEETMTGHGFSSLKNWVVRHCYNDLIEGNEAEMTSESVGASDYENLQFLNLSMIPTVTAWEQLSSAAAPDAMGQHGSKKRCAGNEVHKQPVHRKSNDACGRRTSKYRGVTRHRWTGRYEAHLWDNSSRIEGRVRKGRQVYLGGYDMEEKAARAYDLAALKYWGPSTYINFPLKNYQEEMQEMKNMTRQEYVAYLRRRSSGFSRGASIYRGVTRHHQHGRWQARIGRVAGNKDLYLGTFSVEEEAAEAYDIAAIKFRGANAITNFDITKYDVEKIMASSTLLSGKLARKSEAAIAGGNDALSVHNNNRELVMAEENCSNIYDWNMVFASESPNEKPIIDVSMETCSDVSGEKVGNMHHSNHCAMPRSLSNEGEGSPDRGGLLMLCSKFPTKLISSMPRPSNSMAHMPLFSYWNDA